MLNAALTGLFPLHHGMYDWALPTGGIRLWGRGAGEWTTSVLPSRQTAWPNTRTRHVSAYGATIITAEFSSGYFRRVPEVVIVPGLFGNTRQGPYNLYSRLAFTIAESGLLTITYDPPGSGDSTPMARSFEGDVAALHRIAGQECKQPPILLTHSAGVAVARAAMSEGLDVRACVVVAPVTSPDQLLRTIHETNDRLTLQDPVSIRAGVRYRSSYIRQLAAVPWPMEASYMFLAEHDQYVHSEEALRTINPQHLRYIKQADHAFSNSRSSAQLKDQILEALIYLAQHDT
jgi:pimeloyl-ACP methyl ester carboxylesterase